MKIKVLDENTMIIDREDLQRKFIIKYDYIKGTGIKNYFVNEYYNYFNEDNGNCYYGDYTTIEKALLDIQEEN